MSASRMRARADVRARPISLMAVTVLVGLIGAVAIAALAGARQTDSAYARYRAASNEPEAGVVDCANGFFSPPFDLAAVSNDPSVAARAVVALGPANLVSSNGEQLLYASPDLSATVIALRDPADAAVYEPHVIAGRLPSSSNEIAVGYVDPARTGAPRPAIGDTVEIQMVPATAAASGRIPSDPSKAVVIPAHVTGWVLGAGELVGDAPGIWAGPGFLEAHGDEVWTCDAGIYHLRGGFGGLTPFLANLYEVEPRAALFFNSTAEKVFVERSTHLAAIELRVLALLAGIAGIMILGQFLVRRTSLGAIDTPVLRAIGMTRAQIVWAAALPAVAVACVGALIAIAGAIALSPLFPIGLARIMDPDVGVRGDGLAIVVGVAIIAATTILSVVIPAGRLASTRTGPEGAVEYRGSVRRSALASWLARLPLPASAGAGARLALEPGHGRSATPVRSAVIGLSISVAAMVAAFGFAASMDHFGATPRLYGLNFGFGAGNPFIGDAFQKQAVPVIEADPGLRDLAVGNFQQLVTLLGPGGEVPEIAWALERVKGAQVAPTMLEGRWPESPNEIAVGADTLRKLGSQVGETVTVVVGDRRRDLTVVGVPVFPDFGFGPGLGQGVGTTLEGLRFFYPTVTENLTLGNLAEGSDPAAVVKRLNQAVLRDLDAQALTADNAPQGTTVGATVDSRGLPLQLSILFAFAAFATLVHVLLTSVRRRRRDLAILQTLGFKRGQVAATVAWQSLILASLALVFGVPIGMLLGRLGWSAFAYRLGIVNEPVLSPLSFIVIPVMLAVALLVSLGPGLVARRVKPAAVLKAE